MLQIPWTGDDGTNYRVPKTGKNITEQNRTKKSEGSEDVSVANEEEESSYFWDETREELLVTYIRAA